MRTVNRGMRSTRSSGPGASSAMEIPSTPSVAHCWRARVGPRSGPPCFLDPPTTVGPMRSARCCHAAAPGQPRAAIKSPTALPTVGRAPCGDGHWNPLKYSGRMATRINRGRSCATPKSRALRTFQSAVYPSRASCRRMPLRYASNFAVESPGTFSSSTAFGLASRTIRRAVGKRSRSSSAPCCFPAIENGGHGTPPATRSTPQ